MSYNCADCGTEINDETNFCTWEDQRDLCKECKESLTDIKNDYLVSVWEEKDKEFKSVKKTDVTLLKNNLTKQEKIKYMFVKKFKTISEDFEDLSTIETNGKNKERKNMLNNNLDDCLNCIKFLKEHKVIK